MRIALIGGAGFIGHHLALRLRPAHEVLIVDHLGVNNHVSLLERMGDPWVARHLAFVRERAELWNNAGVDFRLADVADYHRLSRVIAEWKPDVIVHLAAVAHITVTRAERHLAFRTNIDVLQNALDVAIACGVKRFVFFSSSTVYGNFKKPVLDETDTPDPDNTYGAHKLMGELMVKAAHRDKGLPYTIIRPQALYGPRCVSRRVTQIFIENALSGKPLRINGDGSDCHDFTHVDDVTAGVKAAIENDAAINETFCITAGQAHSLAYLASIVSARLQCPIEYGPADPEKPSRGTMSVSKAWKLLGWQPRIRLEDGMNDYIDWYCGLAGSGQGTELPTAAQ